MKVLDLFAGIGGFSLAAHWMGWETVGFVEKDLFCQKVLAKNFPGVPIYGDIHEYKGIRGSADIVCGGFPCQPYSLAGKRKGTADDRHLWPQMLRVIREVQPSFVVGENVFGLVNWSGGLVFEQVQADLEVAGYEVWAGMVPACGKDAPHRRNRLWIIAYADQEQRPGKTRPPFRKGDGSRECNDINRSGRTVADTSSVRRINWGDYRQGRYVSNHVQTAEEGEPQRNGRQCRAGSTGQTTPNTDGCRPPGSRRTVNASNSAAADRQEHRVIDVLRWPTEPPVCRADDGISGGLDEIKQRLQSLGNSIVPQVAFEIFKAIEATRTRVI